MGRMLQEEKNFIINTIDYTPEFFEELKKRLFLALQKYQSSRKTRIVHQLIENNNFELALFAGENEYISLYSYKENRLFNIFLNITVFADYVGNDIISYFGKIMNVIEKINNEKDVISDQRIYNLTKLKAEYNDLMKKFLDGFDYSKIIDGLYYTYLKFLLKRIYSTNVGKTKKLLFLNSQYISSFIKFLYKKYTKTNLDNSIKEKINIICDFFVLVYYFGDNSGIALRKIEKAYNKEAVEFLRKSNHLHCNEFENIVDILFETDTLKIQKNIFNMFMKKEFGELGSKLIKKSKTTMDAFLCSLNHKNILFNAISINEELSFNIEELILNENSRILITKQIKKFI